MSSQHQPSRQEFRQLIGHILGPEHRFYKLVIVYSLAISLLTLAVPISVQLLIDTIANLALLRSVVMISLLLFALLLLSGALYALRAYAMELFTRRFYARISGEITLTALQARSDSFLDQSGRSLFNRYFDIMSLKRNVPYVLTNGFALVLQSVIGFIIVSLYHQYFLVFSLGLILLLWVIWQLWGWPAITSAFALSEAKHQAGIWLQSLAVDQREIKRPQVSEQVLHTSDRLINQHVDCQAAHFHFTFRQLLSMLFLYAAASAILLGIGGMLVINGEITIGQLVAAELIMSAIFVGLPQMAGYLGYYYSICAAVEELGRFRQVSMEPEDQGRCSQIVLAPDLLLRQVRVSDGHDMVEFSTHITGGSLIRAEASLPHQRLLSELLHRDIDAQSGQIQLGGEDIADIALPTLRAAVMVLDQASLLPLTLREYLSLYHRQGQGLPVQEALVMLGLDRLAVELPQGMQTELSVDGWPLSLSQSIRLKLCTALLQPPALLLLGDMADLIPAPEISRFLQHLQQAHSTTVCYFTHRTDLDVFDAHWSLGPTPSPLVNA